MSDARGYIFPHTQGEDRGHRGPNFVEYGPRQIDRPRQAHFIPGARSCIPNLGVLTKSAKCTVFRAWNEQC